MLSFQIGDCRAVAHQCYVTYLYSQPNSWSQIKALLLGLAKKCTLLQSFCKFRLPQHQPSALSISPPAGIKIISAHTFFGFKRTYYTEMVLFELLDETGSKLWFRNTYEKVKSDLWNWNRAKTKKVPFFRDTLYTMQLPAKLEAKQQSRVRKSELAEQCWKSKERIPCGVELVFTPRATWTQLLCCLSAHTGFKTKQYREQKEFKQYIWEKPKTHKS